MQLKFRELKEEGLKNNKRVDQFEGEGKSSATRTFARELLQNTLDARLDKESPAKVNFKIIENHQSKLINDLREDLDLALTNSHSKDDESSKNLLLIEEFGTVGLNGPIGPRKDSNHANFWSNSGSRAGRGKQSKESTTLGGAGVGNIALFLVSGLKTILVYTVRNKVDSSELCIDEEIPQYVMGKIELRDSWLVDNKNDDSPGYTYEGFYSNQDQHGNTIPETDPQEINRFKDIFKLERKPNEIGTSFVIPDIHKR